MPYADPEKRRAHRRAYYAAHREERRVRARREWANRDPAKIRASRRLQRYGLTADQFEILWSRQQGRCALCSEVLRVGGKAIHIDHCHETQRVRGILCARCNLGLGKFGDSIEQLQRAIDYLRLGMQ